MRTQQQEQLSVSNQVDSLVEWSSSLVSAAFEADDIENGCAIADEFFEWIKGDFDEPLLYYCEDELNQYL
jgi:hypothetical protein